MLINEEYRQALMMAVERFVKKETPLSKFQMYEIETMKAAILDVNNSTNRELRDAVEAASKIINKNWRHIFIRSLLTVYIDEVNAQPEFDIMLMYEATIRDLHNKYELLLDNQPEYVKQLREELTKTTQTNISLSEQLLTSQQLNRQLAAIAEGSQKLNAELQGKYDMLHAKYLELMKRRLPVAIQPNMQKDTKRSVIELENMKQEKANECMSSLLNPN